MQWKKPLNPTELACFRQYVITAIPSELQVNIAERLTEILLTDKRIEYLVGAIKQQALTRITTKLNQWHDEDVEGCVTPELLAHDWLTAKNNQPRLWRLIAWLRYPADLIEAHEPTAIGIRLHDIWEQRIIKDRSRVRAFLSSFKSAPIVN